MVRTSFWVRAAVVLAAGMLLATSSGCTFLSQVIMSMEDHRIPAEFAGLEGKKVAVVCLDAKTLRVPGGEAEQLAKSVSALLAKNVKKIEVVPHRKVADWIDNQNSDLIDFRDVGAGVNADMVVGIDLKSFSIHEPGGTLLKGRADVAVTVFDLSKPSEAVFESEPIEMNFPESGARHVTENESKFRVLFVQEIARRVARDFYAYDRMDEFSPDAKFIGD